MPQYTESMFNTSGSAKEKEGTAEFLNFPDSSLYMIGFKYKQPTTSAKLNNLKDSFSARVSTKLTEEAPPLFQAPQN